MCGWPRPVSSRSAKQPGWRSPPIVTIVLAYLSYADDIGTLTRKLWVPRHPSIRKRQTLITLSHISSHHNVIGDRPGQPYCHRHDSHLKKTSWGKLFLDMNREVNHGKYRHLYFRNEPIAFEFQSNMYLQLLAQMIILYWARIQCYFNFNIISGTCYSCYFCFSIWLPWTRAELLFLQAQHASFLGYHNCPSSLTKPVILMHTSTFVIVVLTLLKPSLEQLWVVGLYTLCYLYTPCYLALQKEYLYERIIESPDPQPLCQHPSFYRPSSRAALEIRNTCCLPEKLYWYVQRHLPASGHVPAFLDPWQQFYSLSTVTARLTRQATGAVGNATTKRYKS